jgi:hypothetical protein
MLFEEGGKHSVQHDTGDLLAALDRMGPVHQHFRLDDRNEVLSLAERSIPRQRMRVRVDGSGARQSVVDMDDCPLLRETGAQAAVFLEAFPKPIEPPG